MRFTDHAREQMERRDVTEEDVETAMRHRVGAPVPGSGPGNVVIEGIATGGRRIQIVCSAADLDLVISVWKR